MVYICAEFEFQQYFQKCNFVGGPVYIFYSYRNVSFRDKPIISPATSELSTVLSPRNQLSRLSWKDFQFNLKREVTTNQQLIKKI